MSYINIAKAIAPIATKIGDEIVEGLSGAAKSADDWGWKGGKPGEITGGEFIRKWDTADRVMWPTSSQSIPPSIEDIRKAARSKLKLLEKSSSQLSSGGINTGGENDIGRAMQGFKNLEEADIPREWTGKIFKALNNSSIRMYNNVLYNRGGGGNAIDLSNIMRSMTNPERELFVTILPKARNVENAADIFRAINPLTESQRDTFLSLLPEYVGSLDDLAVTAKTLAD